MTKITIDAQYQRNQFDDWFAGGQIEYKSKKYYWCAYHSNYGFGWEIEPITGNDWGEISENEFNKIITLIERYLNEHRTEYFF